MRSDTAVSVDNEFAEKPETTKHTEKSLLPNFLSVTQTVSPIVTTTVEKQEKPDKAKMDMCTVNIGTKFSHKEFREVIITNINNVIKYICIPFSIRKKPLLCILSSIKSLKCYKFIISFQGR